MNVGIKRLLLLLACLVSLSFAACGAGPSQPQAIPTDVDLVIEIVTSDMRFVPDRVAAPAGSRVAIVLENPDSIRHDLTIDDFDGERIQVEARPRARGILVVTMPDLPGELPFYCAVPGHAQLGMVGVLVVE